LVRSIIFLIFSFIEKFCRSTFYIAWIGAKISRKKE